MEPRAREEGLLVRQVEDETLVYDKQRQRAHYLNPAASLVWRNCDGEHSPEDLSGLLARELNLPADGRIAHLALTDLNRAKLLQEGPLPVKSQPTISRREVIRKLGLVGGLTALLPVVHSIVAPTPAHADSSRGNRHGGKKGKWNRGRPHKGG